MMLPTKPLKKPTIGPKAAPKKSGMATPGRIWLLNGPGMRRAAVAAEKRP